jgi:hypothetical protein
MPSQLSLWIVFPQNSMMTYYLNFLLCVIHWDILDNCKVWIESMMVMLGASCRPLTSRIYLDWALEWWNALDICVGRIILVFISAFFCAQWNWSGNCSQLPISKLCLVKSLIYIISSMFCNLSPTYLQTCSCIMYYVVHKFPNISRATIHLSTHLHPIAKRMCRKSFHEMMNMVADEVRHMPTSTSLVITLFTNMIFLFCYLFNEDG